MIAAQHWEFKSPAETLTLFPNTTMGSHYNKPLLALQLKNIQIQLNLKPKETLSFVLNLAQSKKQNIMIMHLF